MKPTKTNVIIAILLFAALFSQKLSAQTDTEFWLAIPATTTQHGDMGGRIKHIVVSTMGNPATVTVSIPANAGFQPIVVDVPAYTTERIDLFEYYDLIENHLPDVVEDKGILVESTDNITAYLEQVETQNPDIFALKGRHALGTEFYVPMQNKLPNQLYTDVARSSFDIVATEDNTVVTIVPTAPISKADGTFYPAGSTITVTLQRGQTYSARADSETAVGHPAGSHITSTKPIAVTVKDDSVIAGGWDLIGDQLVPVPYTGSQYIVMRGQLNHPDETINKEFTYLVITENATQISVNGTVLGTYNQGDVVPVGITATDPFVVIESNNYQKFYAFHISGNGGEIAGAILPPTDQCSGNSRVGFSYSYGDPGQSLYINIMVQVAAINGFTVDGATAAWLNPASFVTTAGGIWAVARFGPLSATDLAEGAHEITNSLGLFHMGYINYTGPGALYGYFSDFATQEIKAVVIQTNEPIATQCVGEDVRLRVDGGFSYSWTGIKVGQPAYNVMTHFNHTNIYNPVLTNLPVGQYQFTVTVGGACGEPPVNKVIDLTIIQGPTPKTVIQNFCESEIGSGCLSGLNLNNFTNQMTGSWPNTTVIKWEKDAYNEMLLYEDYESDRHISYTGGYINNLNLAQTNPDITGINTSPVVSSMSTRLSGSNVNFIKISPRGGYAFDMSKGDVFTLMAYNHVYNSWAQDGPRAITMRLINGADSIDVVANFTKYDKWEQLTFDFTSFNKNIIYTEMKLIFDVHLIHEEDVFYLDNLKKLVDHQIVVIPDPSSATVCNGATIYATQENDIGCRSNSTLTPNITAGSFAVNNPTIALCENGAIAGQATGVNFNNYTSNVTGGVAGLTVIKWEKTYVNYDSIYENFDNVKDKILFSTVTTPDQSNTAVLNELYANPKIDAVNGSATCGFITNLGTNSYYELSIDLQTPIDLSKGNIFNLMAAYNVLSNNNTNAKTVVMELSGGGNPTRVATAVNIYQAGLGNNVWSNWTDIAFNFSAYATENGFDRITFKFTPNNWQQVQFVIDNFRRTMTPFIAKAPVTNNTVKNGDVVWATVQDANGCKVKSTVTFSVGPGFPINNPTISVCQNGSTAGEATGINYNDYFTNIVPAPTANKTIVTWEFTKTNYDSIYENFDNVKDYLTFNTVTTPDQGNTTTLDETYVNPVTTGVNTSATCGFITNLSTSNYYQLSIDLLTPIDLSKGAVFKLMAAYRELANFNTNAKTVVMELSGGGNTTRVSTAVNIYQAALGNNVWSNWVDATFDFSAYATESGFNKITFKFAPNNWQQVQFIVDNFRRTMTPFLTSTASVTNKTVKDGDVIYATVQDNNGCIVKSAVTFDVIFCLPPAIDSTVTMCEASLGSGNVTGINLTNYNNGIKNNIAANTVTWYSNATLTTLVATPTNVTATNNLKFYALVRDIAASKQDTAVLTFIINSLPNIVFPTINDVCEGAAAFTITGTTPTGGTWSGGAYINSGGTFTPTLGIVGANTVTYSSTVNGCTSTKNTTVTIKPLPNATLVSPLSQTYCGTTGVSIQVSNVTSATYSWKKDGSAIAGGNPLTNALTGTYEVTISLNSCVQIIPNIQVVGKPLPTYSFSANATICEGATLPTPTVSLTGTGPWNITYTINGTPTSTPVATSPFTIPFSSTTPNVYSIALSAISDANCTGVISAAEAVITINAKPTITFNALPTRCADGTAVTLTTYATPVGGTFSGNGVTGSTFTPSGSVIGTNTITYTATNLGCTNTATQNIEVYSLPSVAPVSTTDLDVCLNETITLNGNPTVGSGTYTTHLWSGQTTPLSATNIPNPTFTPTAAGNFVMTYRVTDSHTCSAQGNITVVAHALPVMNTTAIGPFCDNAAITDIAVNGTPSGGTWSGTGVTGSNFNPTGLATSSPVTLTYAYTDTYNCSNSTTRQVIINPIPTIAFTLPAQICDYASPINLSATVTPIGGTGTWSGTGVTGNQFNPTGLSGSIAITYSYSINGCSNTLTKNITVNPRPTLTFTLPSQLCSYDATFALDVTPSGGTFATTYPLTGTSLNPSLATFGQNYSLQYNYQNPTTLCENSISRNTIVYYTVPPVVTNVNEVDQNVYVGHLPSLTATGTAINWFYPTITTQVGTNTSSYTPNSSVIVDGGTSIGKVGVYPYLATQTINGCTSVPAIVNLTIIACPFAAPIITGIEKCQNDVLGNLTASTSSTVQEWKWYNATLVPIVNNNASYAHGVSNAIAATTNFFVSYVGTEPISGKNCESPKTATSVKVNPLPIVSFNVSNPTTMCFEDAAITLNVSPTSPGVGTFSGAVSTSNFAPATVGAGIHTINYSYINEFNCTSSATYQIEVIKVNLPTVNPPKTIVVSVTDVLSGTTEVIAATNMTGASIEWMDATCTTSLGTGLTYDEVLTAADLGALQTKSFTYGARQKIGSCVSACVPATVILSRCPALTPQASDTYYCINGGLPLTVTATKATGSTGAKLSWFSSLVSPSPIVGFDDLDTYTAQILDGTSVGTETVYVAEYDAVYDCWSSRTPVTIHVVANPTASVIIDSDVCSSDGLVSINTVPATGVLTGDDTGLDAINRKWDPNASGIPAPSKTIHLQYVVTETQPDGRVCSTTVTDESTAHFMSPPIPVDASWLISNIANMCTPVDILSATGSNIEWYATSSSTITIGTGNTFCPNLVALQTEANGLTQLDKTYYISQTDAFGCQSTYVPITLSLFDCPAPKPVVVNADACIDDIAIEKTITATATLNPGDEIRWYTTPTVYTTGASFVSPENTPGDYTYDVVVYDAANSCEGPSETASIHIYTPPTLTIIAASEVCENGANVSLQGNPSGGVFSGTGVTADEFIPTSLIAQDYTITYEVLYGSNCTITTTKDITVNESPIVTIQNIGPFCSYETPQTLLVTTTPSGGIGTYTSSTGVDISSGIFNPQLFVAGDVTITYDYETTDGCIGSDNSIITIHAQPNASFSNPGGYCADITNVDLSSFALPVGGVFSGVGVTGNNFNPTIGIIGNNSVNYIYTDANTCKDTVSNIVEVYALPTITFNPQSDICIDDIALPLLVTSNKTIVATTFMGTGVSNPSNWIFTPSVAPQVASTPYTIQTEIEDNQGCKATASGIVTVHYTSPPTVTDAYEITQNVTSATIPVISSVGTDVVVYSDNTLVNQIGTGLSFTAPSSEVIDGVTLKGKAGVYTYYFTQTVNSCESLPEDGTLTLTDCPAPAPIVVDEEICISEAIPVLTATAASTDIRWYNSTSLIFNGASYTPTITNAGTYNFWVSQYDLVNNCEGPKAKVSIVVHDLPIVTIDNLPASMCFDDVSITLQGSPLGGIYTLSDNTEITEVNPSILGAGNHAITYTYTDANTCTNSITENMQVNFTPTPIVQDTTIILYQMYDYLYAQGSGVINWFLPATTNVGTGNLFEHNQITVGQWTYSLNQVILGCTSETVTKTLTIIDCGTPTPTVSPTLVDICDYDPMPTFSFGNIDPQVVQVQVFDSINSVVSSISAGNPYQFTPSALSAGTYTWTVVQDTGCVSSPASFTLRIHEKPTVSITAPNSICIDANPIEIVVSPVGGVLTGTGITGTTFNPSVGEGLYTLHYVYTDSFNCSDNTATGIAVNYTPPPVGQDVISLTVFLTPNLVASGNQIKWYTEVETSNLVFSGNVFPTGIIGVTDTTFYITQTLNGCISEPSPVRMVLSNCPTPAPVSNGFIKCIYEQIPNLIALGDTIAWYSSALGGAPIFEGDTLVHGIVTAGTYSYYVTQKNICESPRTKVTFTIVPQPTVSISSTSDVCRYASNVNLTMVPTGGILSGVGIVSNAFVPDLIPGIYTQTYIYTNVQGCSDTATNSIEIHETQPPLANNLTTFTYNLDPDMDAVGTNVKWYNSASLQPLLYSGTIFPHNHTQDIITDYYVTQTENSCESAPTKVRLQILSCGTPKPDVSPDVDICNYESIPSFQATGLPGATIHWFKSSNPSLEIYEGATFVPNEILPGTYEYYVMQDTGCRGEASIVTLRIHQTNSPTVLPTQNICEFKPNPTMRVTYTADSVLWYNQNPGYPASISPIHRGLQFQSSEIAPGNYMYYVVKKSNNCYSNPVQTSYTIFKKPTTPIVEDLSSCENESIQTFVTQDFLTGSVKWLDSYKRIVKEDAFDYTPSLSLLRLNRSVVFSAYITENGCVSDTSNFDYLYIPRPIEPIVSNPYICEGSTILPISAVGTNVNWYAEDALTLLAENSSTYTPQITSETGVYTYWITQTINTCRSLKRRVTFTVVPIPHPIIIGDSTVCEGTLAVMYNVVNSKPEETYSWEVTGDNINYSVDGTMQLHSIYADWNTQGIDSVIVTATNEQNCSSTDYRTVYIASKPYPDFEWEFPGASIVTEFTNTTIQQPVSDGDSVVQIEFESTWDFGFPTNAPSVVQPWEDIDKPMQNEYLYGVYPVTLSVVNEYGCANIIEKEIFVDILTSLYVPTALSPFNPALEVRYFEPKGYNIKLFEIWIFDSWGNLVWYDTWNCDTDEGTPLTRWDGTYNGEVLKSDTYIWKIETTFKDGRAWEGMPTIRGFEKFGSIVLLR